MPASICRWLANHEGTYWWREDDTGPAAVRAKYSPAIDGHDARFIQRYRLGNSPDDARKIPVGPEAGATDLFIGDPDFRGKGRGSVVLGEFLSRVGLWWVAMLPVVDEELPLDSGDEYVMVLQRNDWLTAPDSCHSERSENCDWRGDSSLRSE